MSVPNENQIKNNIIRETISGGLNNAVITSIISAHKREWRRNNNN